MKRILSIVLAVAVLATLGLTFASCGKLSGTYESKGVFTTTSLTFKGDTVTIEMGSVKAEGTYEIKDEKNGNAGRLYASAWTDCLQQNRKSGNKRNTGSNGKRV